MSRPSLATTGRILTILGALVLGTSATGRADTQTLSGVDAPLIRIENSTGNVIVKTWARPDVQIDADADVRVDRTRLSVQANSVPILAGRVIGPQGEVRLPEESFAVTTLGPRERDVIAITGKNTGPVTVTIPNATALLVVSTQRASIAIHRYTGGTIIARVQGGRIRLDRDGGSAFVQVMRGPILVNDSNFDRIRSRTALGPTIFERCHVRQIEATSVSGSIVYDRGGFEPGLARFQSESGNVAVGVDGAARIGGHGGHVYTAFTQPVEFARHDASVANAIVAGGGPQVNAASASGNVYLYDGSLRERPNLGAEWDPVSDLMRQIPTRPGPNIAPQPQPPPRRRPDGPPRFPIYRPRGHF